MKIILVVLVGFMVACSEQGVELTGPVPLSTEIQTTKGKVVGNALESVSYTHLRAHETLRLSRMPSSA